MSPLPRRVAFVSGANGISGNAIIEHLIREPKSKWQKIIVTSRSPLKLFWQDDRVEFVAIDFLKPVEEIVAIMKPCCHDVTHAFYTSYVHTDDFTQLPVYNVPLWEHFLKAVETVAGSNLHRVCLQTGGKHYGAHLGPYPCPYREDQPRYDDKGENFYYAQEDFMFARQQEAAAQGHYWHYNIIRPNGIIGFTPVKNGMSEAITIALYFLVNREMGTEPRFPGNAYFYNTPDDCSSAKGLADLSVWAMTEEHTKDETFNHVNGDTYIWRYLWPRLGAYFGVAVCTNLGQSIRDPSITKHIQVADVETPGFNGGIGGNNVENSFQMCEWAKNKRDIWKIVVQKYGGDPEAFGRGTWAFFDWATGKNWPTLSSMNKARAYGWNRCDDSYESYMEAFRAFENAGILPRSGRNTLVNGDVKINGRY